jgi:hypothetical protein
MQWHTEVLLAFQQATFLTELSNKSKVSFKPSGVVMDIDLVEPLLAE